MAEKVLNNMFLNYLQSKFDHLATALTGTLNEVLEKAASTSDAEFVNLAINSPLASHFGAMEFAQGSYTVPALLQTRTGMWYAVRQMVEQRVFIFLREVHELANCEIWDPSRITYELGKQRASLLDLLIPESRQNDLDALVSKYSPEEPDPKVLEACLEEIQVIQAKYKVYRSIYWRVCDPDIYALMSHLLPYAEDKEKGKVPVLQEYLKTILKQKLPTGDIQRRPFDSVADIWWILSYLYTKDAYKNDLQEFKDLFKRLSDVTAISLSGDGSDEEINKYRAVTNITPELFDDRWSACLSAVNIMNILAHPGLNEDCIKDLRILLRKRIFCEFILPSNEDGLLYYYALKLRCINQYLCFHLREELEVFYPGVDIKNYLGEEGNCDRNVFFSNLDFFQIYNKGGQSIPVHSVNRSFKESINGCMTEINAYSKAIMDGTKKEIKSMKPMPVFVCAEPGAGKSYLVRTIGGAIQGRQLITEFNSIDDLFSWRNRKAMRGDNAAVALELNLSQISSWKEVHDWLSLTAKLVKFYPKLLILLFFDEIDGLHREVDIYNRLLGPLADGEIFCPEDGSKKKCSPIVWFFAASRVRNFADLKRFFEGGSVNKGPDFLSRIRHSITMNSYARLEDWKERVLLARSILKTSEMTFSTSDEEQKVLKRFAYGMGTITTARAIKHIIGRVRYRKKQNLTLHDFDDLLWPGEK